MKPIGRVISNSWRDDVCLLGCAITEVVGESYDSRRLALYRVEGKGLFWLPRWAVTFKE